ncbi:DNA integrity scanning protein DisA nucleotide-binding domain protein [Natrinema salifodinae]|uniref:DisA checkpoint controller nucleotide-binding n=1 Tax=Natrinema salifodinae TaxID=1202768 RepID=A0A1I0MGB8_9EURY|nr:diadenylate cyclase [Natrinema salifodinae]SEV87423.1 DisA checkpoint controller nucleotide-binding [Natrinema salifodinae]
MADSDLRIEYETHDGVRELLDCLVYSLEGISLDFDRWNERYVKGPGMYIAVVTGPSVAAFADPMGDNTWPTDRCRDVCLDLDVFFETAREVAMTRDGAVVISVDGVIQEQLVRFRDLAPDDRADVDSAAAEYEDWMGSRHMSALDTSRRPNVIATVTLSEETGRVSVFQRGDFRTDVRPELGGEWNVDGYRRR